MTDNIEEINGDKTRSTRWLTVVAGGISVGATLLFLFASGRLGGVRAKVSTPGKRLRNQPVDDRGTSQDEATQILRKLRDRGFEASYEKLALALGRPTAEVEAWDGGLEVIDDDVVMKARGIALQRGIVVE